VTFYNDGQSVTCNVTSPVTEGSTIWTCTGWIGTGSVPSSGTGTSVTFSISANSTITWTWSGQPVQRKLIVVSAHGNPSPAVGDSFYSDGSQVNASIASPVVEGGITYLCTGWSGTGSVPTSGNGTSVSFAISENSSLTWNWLAQHNLSLHLNSGWNMISFPVIPSNTSFASIFSGAGYYQVTYWTGTSYATATNAEASRGYWVLVLSTTTLNVTGTAVESYELDLPAGWSMIGSVNGAVNASSVFPSYYQLETWNGTSYVAATAIEPGKGYFVLVLTPTHITV
jgi:hypothetical protein